MSRYVSSIYSQGQSPSPKGHEAEQRNHRARKALWHKMGIAAFDPNEINDDWMRQAIENLAVQTYGKRNT